MSLAITNIGSLVTNDPNLGIGILGELENATLVIENGKIAWVGNSGSTPATDQVVDAQGMGVIPGFVDSHAHLVFATVDLIPPAEYFSPFMRASNSFDLSPAKTMCAWESTKPGITPMPCASIT